MIEMYRYSIEKKLKATLKRTYKKNRGLYEAVMKKIEEVIKNPHRYKPLRYDLKGLQRVHVGKSFVLVFEIDEITQTVKFFDLDHHDEIYSKRR